MSNSEISGNEEPEYIDCLEETRDVYEDELSNDDEDNSCSYYRENDCSKYCDKLKRLEDEQDQLNGSLIALTSHFAQVQLRLKQICDASPEQKENLLKELEEFAFRSIPDLRDPIIEEDEENEGEDNGEQVINKDGTVNVQSSKLEAQRAKQKQLIAKLKCQLEDLEQYAYETGQTPNLPSSWLLERQTVIIEQLRGKLPLELDQLDKLTPDDLRKQVDNAIRKVNFFIMISINGFLQLTVSLCLLFFFFSWLILL